MGQSQTGVQVDGRGTSLYPVHQRLPSPVTWLCRPLLSHPTPAFSRPRGGRAWKSTPGSLSGPAGSGRLASTPIPLAGTQSHGRTWLPAVGKCGLSDTLWAPERSGDGSLWAAGGLSLTCFSWGNCKTFTVSCKMCYFAHSIKSCLQNPWIYLWRDFLDVLIKFSLTFLWPTRSLLVYTWGLNVPKILFRHRRKYLSFLG